MYIDIDVDEYEILPQISTRVLRDELEGRGYFVTREPDDNNFEHPVLKELAHKLADNIDDIGTCYDIIREFVYKSTGRIL